MNGDDPSAVSPLIVQQASSPWIKCRLGTHERKRPRPSPKRLGWPELTDRPLGPCDSAVGPPILIRLDYTVGLFGAIDGMGYGPRL